MMSKILEILCAVLLSSSTLYAQNEPQRPTVQKQQQEKHENINKEKNKKIHSGARKNQALRRSSSRKSTQSQTRTDTYVKVDGKYFTTSSHSASGGTEYFNISTNASTWTTWGVPSWCSIGDRTSNSFRLRVNENNSTSERSDYMEVRTPNGHSARINIKQSGKKATEPSAQVESITVDYNQNLDDGKGMIIHVKFNIQNMKGKNGRVSAYFYDNNGNALIDTNDKYNTTGTPSNVATGTNITPGYDNTSYSDLKLTIPYSELHQTGTSTRTLKFKISIWDRSVTPSKEIYNGSTWTTFLFTPGTEASLTVDGSTSNKTKHFSESGGRETYYVKTSASSYETWGVPSWCSIENKTASSFTLVCKKNTNRSARSDYMKVKAAGKEIRIDIKQDACSGPTAKIVSVSQEHNVTKGFNRGMNIKLKFETSGMLNKKLTATALFYYADNTTQLKNIYGGQVHVSQSDTAPYENTTFTMTLYLPYSSLNMARGFNGSLSFDISITDSYGNSLARKNNYTFTYYQP